MFFGGGDGKQKGKTFLLLDVENGSVASGLLYLEAGEKPKIFGHTRQNLSVARPRSAATLAQSVAHAAREALHHASTVAARIREHNKLSHIGEVGRAEIFLSAPWTNLDEKWLHETGVNTELHKTVEEFFGAIPVSSHPFPKVLAEVSGSLFPEDKTLLVFVGGEITELLLVHGGRVVGRATTPHGHHLLLRTLKAHGGLSESEARSALHLQPSHAGETFAALASHFTREFKDTARELLSGGSAQSVYVVSHEPTGEWFAKVLGSEDLGDLFPDGGTVRALRTHHVAPYLAAHTRPDLVLSLQAIFVDENFSSRRF